MYHARKAEAHYTGYVGPILDFFSAKLLSAAILARPKSRSVLESKGPDAPDAVVDSFYAQWKEDVDGAGTDLVDFIRSRFSSACVKGRSWWLVEMPEDDGAVSLAEWESRRLGDGYVTALDNEQVLDWEVDGRGQLEWAIVHSFETRRPSVGLSRGRVRETWRVYDAATLTTYAVEYDPTKGEPRPESAVLVGSRNHGFSRVPLVRLGFVGVRGVKVKVGGRTVRLSSSAIEGFWLMQRLADPQIAHFRSEAALDWNIKRTCYAMPVFRVVDTTKPPVMGAGYYIMIGEKEGCEWIAPPTDHLDLVSKRSHDLKDAIYRVANQLAQSVDNSASVQRRSGESKQADASSTEVTLRVYGALCREAIEQTYELLSEGRGDSVVWSIEGLDTFSLTDAEQVVDAATKAQGLRVGSLTFQKELTLRVADALLPGVDQGTKDAIRREIEESAEQMMAEAAEVRKASLKTDAEDTEPPSEPPASKPATAQSPPTKEKK